MRAHVCACVEARVKFEGVVFFPFHLWVLRIEGRSPGLTACTFSHEATWISPDVSLLRHSSFILIFLLWGKPDAVSQRPLRHWEVHVGRHQLAHKPHLEEDLLALIESSVSAALIDM